MTPGMAEETLDGITLKYLLNIQKKLRSGQYQFPPARRTQIPKPGKKETRPITIASPRDKIVQKAIQLVMEQVYEQKFIDSSHGFRHGRGTKTAIRYIDAKFQSVHYIIEADFTKAFDTIPHSKLMMTLKETITCEKTLALLKSSLKAGYFEFGELHHNLAIGTPQGSIISPLLCNIYLHKLDLFIEQLKEKYQSGDSRKRSKEYVKIQNQLRVIRKKGIEETNPQFEELRKKLHRIPSLRHDDSFTRIQYIRYADDFIVGIEGSYKLAQVILAEITQFTEKTLGLSLHPEKTGIVKYFEKPIAFLGYLITSSDMKGIEKPLEQIKVGARIITRRKKLRVRVFMDLPKVLKKLTEGGFVKQRTSHLSHGNLVPRGTFQGNLINLEHESILQYYNSKIRGIYNYYNFVKNFPKVQYIAWLLNESCALTLSRKLKINTLRKTIQKFGKDLACEITSRNGEKQKVALLTPDALKRVKITAGGNVKREPLASLTDT